MAVAFVTLATTSTLIIIKSFKELCNIINSYSTTIAHGKLIAITFYSLIILSGFLILKLIASGQKLKKREEDNPQQKTVQQIITVFCEGFISGYKNYSQPKDQ